MDMYEQLMNASQGNQGQNLFQLFEQMGVSDPRLKVMAEFMARQQEQSDADETVEPGNITKQPDENNLDELLEDYDLIADENERLLERNDILAAALGACAECWGEDLECDICHGRGGPGAYMPEQKVFAEYVLPAMKRMRTARRTTRMKNSTKEVDTSKAHKSNNGNGDNGSN